MTLDTLADQALPYLSGAPKLLIVNALNSAARDLCREAEIWREEITAVTTGQLLALTLPDGATLVSLAGVWVDDVPLVASSAILGQQARNGTPSYYTITSAGALSLYPQQAGLNLTMLAVLMPVIGDASAMPAFLVDRHAQALIHGAVYRVRITPGTQWHDVNAAMYHQQQFESLKGDAKLAAQAGLGQQQDIVRGIPI